MHRVPCSRGLAIHVSSNVLLPAAPRAVQEADRIALRSATFARSMKSACPAPSFLMLSSTTSN